MDTAVDLIRWIYFCKPGINSNSMIRLVLHYGINKAYWMPLEMLILRIMQRIAKHDLVLVLNIVLVEMDKNDSCK